MFPSGDGPRYVPGGIALAVFCGAVCMSASRYPSSSIPPAALTWPVPTPPPAPAAATTIKFALRRENKKMDRMDAEGVTYAKSLEGIPKGYRFTS